MNIIKSIQARWRNGQKGDVLVMTALILPALIASIGFAVDGGNLCYEKVRLQNAADAAALAGANEYVNQLNTNSTASESYRRNYTNRVARRYINGAYHNLEKNEDVTISPQFHDSSSNNNVTYYTVGITKKVPLHFMSLFMGDTQDVNAHSNAKITASVEKKKPDITPQPPYLFVFKKNLTNVNSIENPDNWNLPGRIVTTFDGKVIYTDDNPNRLEYSTQAANLKALFTERARQEGLSVNDALAQAQSIYDPDTGANTNNGYWSAAEHGTYDYTIFSKWINNYFDLKTDNTGTLTGKVDILHEKNLIYSNIETNENHLQKYEGAGGGYGDKNVDINITREIQGDINSPVVIQMPDYGQNLNINLNADTRRPLFIYWPKAENEQQTSNIHINLNGHTFRGFIFAPYINDEGVLINANGGTFSGSIIASSINLQGGKGTFKYESFFDSDSGTSSGSGSSTKITASTSYQVALIRDKDMG